mmetsp:Transcript_66980/g.174321  ORF Transcript_66980/g.174321 Transcript_66980/m.174321 type:complete len:329 (-) Transcript_66980:103-1089(-)
MFGVGRRGGGGEGDQVASAGVEGSWRDKAARRADGVQLQESVEGGHALAGTARAESHVPEALAAGGCATRTVVTAARHPQLGVHLAGHKVPHDGADVVHCVACRLLRELRAHTVPGVGQAGVRFRGEGVRPAAGQVGVLWHGPLAPLPRVDGGGPGGHGRHYARPAVAPCRAGADLRCFVVPLRGLGSHDVDALRRDVRRIRDDEAAEVRVSLVVLHRLWGLDPWPLCRRPPRNVDGKPHGQVGHSAAGHWQPGFSLGAVPFGLAPLRPGRGRRVGPLPSSSRAPLRDGSEVRSAARGDGQSGALSRGPRALQRSRLLCLPAATIYLS